MNLASMQASILPAALPMMPSVAALWGYNKTTIDLKHHRFISNTSVYDYALTTLQPQLSNRLLGYVSPASPVPHFLADYLYVHKAFVFFTNSDPTELAMATRVLASMPCQTVVLGFWGSSQDSGLTEYSGVGLAGNLGILTLVSDYTTNLSFLSALQVDIDNLMTAYRARTQPTVMAPVALDNKSVYLSFQVVESGDSPAYWQYRQADVWADPRRGQVPIGWGAGPFLYELMPALLAWFLNEATGNDFIYGAISGAAYTHPYRNLFANTSTPEQCWLGYRDLTTQGIERSQTTAFGLYTNSYSHPFNRTDMDPTTAQFAARPNASTCNQTSCLPRLAVLGMGRDANVAAPTNNYRVASEDGREIYASHVMTRWPLNYTSLTQPQRNQWLVDDIQAQVAITTTRPLVMSVMALSWAYGPGDITDIAEVLGSGYKTISVPQLQMIVGSS
jgi:hypothetical protein